MDANLFLKSELEQLQGHVLTQEEFQVVAEAVSCFKYQVEPNITWFLQNLSMWRAVVGFVCARAEKIHREEEKTLEQIVAARYVSSRNAGLKSKINKAPPAEALKHIVRSDSEYQGQKDIVSRAEFHRDLLRELKGTLQTKSREVDQLCNNMRLEVRTDIEES